jgi:hypothetical protein
MYYLSFQGRFDSQDFHAEDRDTKFFWNVKSQKPAITRQVPLNNKRRMAFSAQSLLMAVQATM